MLLNHREIGCLITSLISNLLVIPGVPYPDYPSPYMLDFGCLIVVLTNLLVFMVLLILMIIAYSRFRYFFLILIVYVVSLVVGVNSIVNSILPFSPNIEFMFILVQSLFMGLTLLCFYESLPK